MNFSDYLYYDTSSPTGLRWSVVRYGGTNHTTPLCTVGDVAGFIGYISKTNRKRYARVKCDNSVFLNHRIIWELFYGKIPEGKYVDHINGVSTDNRIENLRLVTPRQSNQNQGKNRRNSSGVKGVNWHVIRDYTYARAFCKDSDGKIHQKSFGVHNMGLLPAFSAAVIWRKNMLIEFNKNGCDYTSRHTEPFKE